MPNYINLTLMERYHTEELLGEGGMGVVYTGRDDLLQRTVAIKLLSAKGLGTEGKARMLREARSAAGLNHPNIVTVYDAGEAEMGPGKRSRPFVIMELVKGRNLAENPPKDISQVVDVAKQLCAALNHAHNHHIIHRDLKPENVLLTEDGLAKLVDFGLARSVSTRLTTEGTIAGTLSYMAPELALGQEFDGRVDLYSLGVMLYELTTGELPFTADDPVSIITQHLYSPVVPPRAHNPTLPVVLDTLIVRLMEKSPEDRPSSANDVLKILERIDEADPEIAEERELTLLDRIVRGRLVGRKNELAEARALWDRATMGQGQMLLISGEPGIGKTRLTRELITQVEVMNGRVLLGECYAEGGAPYAPFALIIRRAFANGTGSSLNLPDHIMADLLNLSPNLWPHYPDIKPNPPLEPQLEQQRLFENMVALFKAISEERPVMIIIEDAHWADSGSLAMMRHIARRIGKLPIMIVATYREVELDENLPFNQVLLDLNRERLAIRIKLSRFGKEDTEALLSALFEEEITPSFLEGIFRETEGNPFFVEEVCKSLVESGQLYFEDGAWQRPAMTEMTIPQSVRVTIQTRVSNLPQEYQDTLKLAAILGREFDYDTLVEASEIDEDQVIDSLEAAERVQLIESTSGVSFTFVHALIPSTLVESVHMLRRRRMHRKVAVAIEKIDPDDDEALARHFGEAGDDSKALTYYTRAGEKALAAYANQEATNYFQAALNLTSESDKLAHLHSQVGVVLSRLSRYEEANQNWRKAIEIYEETGDLEKIAWSYARMARSAWDAGDTPGGLDLCLEGLEKVNEAPDSAEKADLLHETARAYHFMGRGSEGRSLCDQAYDIASRTGAVEVQAEAQITQALLLNPHEEKTRLLLEEAIRFCSEHQLLAQEARARNNLSISLAVQGDIGESREQLLQAAALAREMGDLGMELLYVGNELFWATWQGDLQYAERQLEEGRKKIELMADPGTAGLMYKRNYAYWLSAKGEIEQSAADFRRLTKEARPTGDLQTLSGCLLTSSWPLNELGAYHEIDENLDEAIGLTNKGIGAKSFPRLLKLILPINHENIDLGQKLLNEIRQEYETNSSPINLLWLQLAEAHLMATRGQWQEANNFFDLSMDRLSIMSPQMMAVWKRDWAERLIGTGQSEHLVRARELLEQARSDFEEIGSPYYYKKIDALLEVLDSRS